MTKKKFTKVYIRVFPVERMIWDDFKILNDHKTIYIRYLQQLNKTKDNAIPTFWTFPTDYVFYHESQSQIYDCVVPDLLDNISEGRDGLVLVFGQTGTGKSLTINGVYNPYEERGILPRLASDLFYKVGKSYSQNNLKLSIQVSYVELTRTAIFDLTRTYPNQVDNPKNIAKITVRCIEDVFKIIFKGEGRKIFSESAHYPSHSCSSVFTFHIFIKKFGSEGHDAPMQKCKLQIVDLAGVDTVGNLSCIFKSSQEVGTANLEKSQLEQFLLMVNSNVREYVKIKQRINPLIFHLSDILKRTTIFRIIGHVRTAHDDLPITISLLRFGNLMCALKATKYEVSIEKQLNRNQLDSLEKELTRLESEHDNIMIANQDLDKSLNEERFGHIERTIQEYLQNKITTITLLNVCDIKIALDMLKMICKRYEQERARDGSISKQTGRKLSGNSNGKARPKSSRESSRTFSSEKLIKKSSDEKPNEERKRSLIEIKASKEQIEPLEETKGSRPKTSASSIKRTSLSDRRRSGSQASLHEKKSKGSKEEHLLPENVPKYKDAWKMYVQDKYEEYTVLTTSYKANEDDAKKVYKKYVKTLEALRQILERVEKHKNDLLMAKMTRQFQQAHNPEGEPSLSDFEKCCKHELEKAELEKFDQQELALKYQAEMKIYVNICAELKKDLDDSFNAYCRQFYQTSVFSLEPEKDVPKMDVSGVLISQPERTKISEPSRSKMNEASNFERYKNFIQIEKKTRKRLYNEKHREWINY